MIKIFDNWAIHIQISEDMIQILNVKIDAKTTVQHAYMNQSGSGAILELKHIKSLLVP